MSSPAEQNKWDRWMSHKVRMYFCNWQTTWLTPAALHRRKNLIYVNDEAWDEYIDFYQCSLRGVMQPKSIADNDIYGTLAVVDTRKYSTQINTNIIQIAVDGAELMKGTSSRSQPLPDDDPRSCATIPGYGTYTPPSGGFFQHDNVVSLLRRYHELYGASATNVVVVNTETSRCYFGVIERLSPEFDTGYAFSANRTYEIEVFVSLEGYIVMSPPQMEYPIVSTSAATDTVTVHGDVAADFAVDRYFTIVGSLDGNDGLYSIKSINVNTAGNTILEVNEAIPAPQTVGGLVYRTTTYDDSGSEELVYDFRALDNNPITATSVFIWRATR